MDMKGVTPQFQRSPRKDNSTLSQRSNGASSSDSRTSKGRNNSNRIRMPEHFADRVLKGGNLDYRPAIGDAKHVIKNRKTTSSLSSFFRSGKSLTYGKWSSNKKVPQGALPQAARMQSPDMTKNPAEILIDMTNESSSYAFNNY